MLLEKGHYVILYAAEGSDAKCSEFVQTHTLKQIREAFGDKDYRGNEEIGYEWQTQQFRHDFDLPEPPIRKYFKHRLIAEITVRQRKNDFLLMAMGNYHKEIAKQVQFFLECESGIGYFCSSAKFCVFESTFIMHYDMGMSKDTNPDGKNYHRVIPNFFRVADYPYVAHPAGDVKYFDSKRGQTIPYFVYLGRIIRRKGIQTLVYVTAKAGVHLIIGGQGGRFNPATRVLEGDGFSVTLNEKQTFIGFVDEETRKTLLGNAIATITPSEYMEPFCGVAVESQMCGTPAITTDFGAFTDTIEHGRTGFRCNSCNDFVQAIKHAHLLDREYICKRAQSLYSCEAVNELYEKYFQDVYDVYESSLSDDALRTGGFFKIRTEREEEEEGTSNSFFAIKKPFEQAVIRTK